jgi:hypothetical protein
MFCKELYLMWLELWAGNICLCTARSCAWYGYCCELETSVDELQGAVPDVVGTVSRRREFE